MILCALLDTSRDTFITRNHGNVVASSGPTPDCFLTLGQAAEVIREENSWHKQGFANASAEVIQVRYYKFELNSTQTSSEFFQSFETEYVNEPL